MKLGKLRMATLVLSALLFAAQASAGNHGGDMHYGMAGCGLGSLVFKDKPGKIQIVAATVNGTFGSQTFGITSGTSNCWDDPGSHADLFITINHVALKKDISRGNGETIAALAKIYNCDNSELSRTLQSDYGKIYQNEPGSKEVSSRIRNIIHTDTTLADKCRS